MALTAQVGVEFIAHNRANAQTAANMYADISFEDMQNGLNGLYENEQST